MHILKFTIINLLLSLLFIPNVNATSGTCSSHGGVNCHFGPDGDGSAICNDGWRDSTENYSDTNVCFQCVNPDTYHTGCKNEYDLGKVKIQAEQYGGMMSSQAMGMITNCENEIKKYNEYIAQYNDCQSKKTSYQDNTSYQTNDNNLEAIDKQIEQLKQQIVENQKNLEIQRTNALNNLCKTYGAKKYNETVKNCICGEGYVFIESRCMTHTEDCQDLFGDHIYGLKAQDGNPNNSDCYCDTGYNWNKEKQRCFAPQNDNIITPVITGAEKEAETKIEIADEPKVDVKPVVAINKVNTAKPITITESETNKSKISTNTENIENKITTTEDNIQVIEEKPKITKKPNNVFTKITKFIKNFFGKLKFW